MPLFNIIKKKTIQKNNLRNEGTFFIKYTCVFTNVV